MSARIARGSPQRQRRNAKPAPRKARGRAKVAPAAPLPEAVRRASWWMLIAMLAALALAVASAFGVPQMAGTAIGETVGKAGFAVNRYEISYVDRIARETLSQPMPLVDLQATRQRLLRFGWVRDARVSRRLPDTLVVDIVERRPAAIWQHNRQLALIDRDGVVLEAVRLEAMPDLPLVIGSAANEHVTALAALTDAAPHLKPLMAGASWVGGRRWDLRFQTGETVTLPEGEKAARKALQGFAKLDQSTSLLGRGYVRIDMRIPGRATIRISRIPGGSVPDVAPEPPPTKGAVGDVGKTI